MNPLMIAVPITAAGIIYYNYREKIHAEGARIIAKNAKMLEEIGAVKKVMDLYVRGQRYIAKPVEYAISTVKQFMQRTKDMTKEVTCYVQKTEKFSNLSLSGMRNSLPSVGESARLVREALIKMIQVFLEFMSAMIRKGVGRCKELVRESSNWTISSLKGAMLKGSDMIKGSALILLNKTKKFAISRVRSLASFVLNRWPAEVESENPAKFSGIGEVNRGFFVRKPKNEVKLINRDNRTFVSAQFYLKERQVSELEFLDAAEISDCSELNKPREPIQTGFDFELPDKLVRSYAYDHTSIVNLQHAISNRMFRPNSGVDRDWLRRLNLVTEREFANLLSKLDPDFIDRTWISPEDLIEGKQGFGEAKKQAYRDAVARQREGIVGTKYYTGFVKAYETYTNPKRVQGNVIYNDKKRARLVENRPMIAAGIPWIISNWLNATLGTLEPAYSYRASEKTLSQFLAKMKRENKRYTLSTDFGAMDATVYHETQEVVERKLLRMLKPMLKLRLKNFGFPDSIIEESINWMTATIKRTKFYTNIGKVILKRKGGRASGDPSTTWANTLTTVMFGKTCIEHVGGAFALKVSGDDLTAFSSNRNQLIRLRDEMLRMTSRDPEEDLAHSGFVISLDECVLGFNRATFCSKTLHIEQCAVLPNLTNFYFNSRLYTGSNRQIQKDWKIHRFAVALSRLLAAGSSAILQEYPLQMCEILGVSTINVRSTISELTRVVVDNKVDYFKMFGDFWNDQEISSSDDVDLLVVQEANREGINLDVMMERPEGNVKYCLMSGFKNKNSVREKREIMSGNRTQEARNLMAHFFHPDGQPVRISAGGRKDIAVGSIKQHHTDTASEQIRLFRFQMHDLNTLGYVYHPAEHWYKFSSTNRITSPVGPQNTEYLVTSYNIVMEETAAVTNMQGRFYVLHSNVDNLSPEDIKQHPNTIPISIRDTVIQTMVPDTPNDLLFIRSPTDSVVMERFVYVLADGTSTNSRIAVTISVKYEFVIINQYKGIASSAQKVGGPRLLEWISEAAGKFNSMSPDSKRAWMDNLANMYRTGLSITQAITKAPKAAAPVLALMGSYNMDRAGSRTLFRTAPLKKVAKKNGKKKKKGNGKKGNGGMKFAGFKRVNVNNYEYVEGAGESHPRLLTVDGKTYVAVDSIHPEEAREYWLRWAKNVFEEFSGRQPLRSREGSPEKDTPTA